MVLGLGERFFGVGLEHKVVSDLFVFFHFFFGQHIKYGFGVGIVGVGLSLLQGYFLVFLLWMSLLGIGALNTLDGLIVVSGGWVFALFPHPVFEETNSLELRVQHYDCLNYNIKAPTQIPLEF